MAEDRARVVVRMPLELLAALDRLGEASRRPRSQLIRESVERYVAAEEREMLRNQLIAGYKAWEPVYAALGEEQWNLDALPQE
jgi:metal-responsive CopG/Arc/MetJ family transcriptional regulator